MLFAATQPTLANETFTVVIPGTDGYLVSGYLLMIWFACVLFLLSKFMKFGFGSLSGLFQSNQAEEVSLPPVTKTPDTPAKKAISKENSLNFGKGDHKPVKSGSRFRQPSDT